MTRDIWLRQCAQRFIDRSDVDTGEAAAYAKACADEQAHKHGIRPADWDKPADAADTEMQDWEAEA